MSIGKSLLDAQKHEWNISYSGYIASGFLNSVK